MFLSEIPNELIDLKSAMPERSEASSIKPYSYKPSSTLPPRASFQGSAPKAPPGGKCDLKAGDRVRHKKFGDGMVLSAVPVGNDTKLEIAFENAGTKTLLALYANLTKI